MAYGGVVAYEKLKNLEDEDRILNDVADELDDVQAPFCVVRIYTLLIVNQQVPKKLLEALDRKSGIRRWAGESLIRKAEKFVELKKQDFFSSPLGITLIFNCQVYVLCKNAEHL